MLRLGNSARFIKLLVFIAAVGLILPSTAFSAKAKTTKKKQPAKTAKKTTPKSKWSGKPFSFKFNPPDGVTFTETEKISQAIVLDGEEKEKITVITKATFTIKKAADGYTVMRLPVSVDIKQDGVNTGAGAEKTVNATGLVKDKMNLVYHLNDQGLCTDISGFESLLESGGTFVSKRYGDLRFNMAITPEVIAGVVVNEVAAWNSTITRILDIAGNPGDSLNLNLKLPFLEGVENTPTAVTLKIADPVHINGTECAHVIISAIPDADYVDIFASDHVAEQIRKRFPFLNNASFSNVQIIQHGDVTVERSMLLHKLIDSTTIKMNLDIPGQGKFKGAFIEKRECSYQYTKQ